MPHIGFPDGVGVPDLQVDNFVGWNKALQEALASKGLERCLFNSLGFDVGSLAILNLMLLQSTEKV